MTAGKFTRLLDIGQAHAPWSTGAVEASADQLPAELHPQLPIKTGIFDPPALSSAKWNSLSVLLGLAG